MKEGTSTTGGGSFPKKHPERLVWCLIIMIIIIIIIHLFAGAFQGPQGRLTEHQLSMSMRITDLEGLG